MWIVAALVWLPCAAQAQDVASWTVEIGQNYRIVPDITYLAPPAVVDCRCALRWVIEHEEYGLDKDRIVLSGTSAGGHLSLTTGMLPVSAGLDGRCPAINPDGKGRADAYEPEMPVAAIVNWFGITDVADLVEGPNAKMYAIQWMGGMADWRDVARRVSPLEYVRSDLPPILTIHGFEASSNKPRRCGSRA